MSTHAEKEYYRMNVSVNKALNGIEAPLKTKHARFIIIMIHKTKEVNSFWMIVSRQPLLENRFTAWKFCHLLHKVLREAHGCSLKHSQSRKKMILEMGKLWGHLHDDIGNCIKEYCKLLVTKLNFHDKNRGFPGSLVISMSEISKFADKDLNYYFQLCVEIFDYLEDIISVQLAIFSTINTYRLSSMTLQGQCRLAPLICLIQDSNPLYDISVRLMFKLHESLPNDVLSGHRDRFYAIFLKLKEFYDNIRPLQYFKDLITVPELPQTSPNFQSQVDFGSYIPPVVFVQPEPEPDVVVDDLVDTNNTTEEVNNEALTRINILESIINDKDMTIEALKSKLDQFQQNFVALEQNYNHDVAQLQKQNEILTNDLELSQDQCDNLRSQNDDLELKLTDNPMLIQKANEEEEKQKMASEKFNKLKTMYTQIRDEHINLLREHSESTKNLTKGKQANSELLLQIEALTNDMAGLKNNIEDKNKTNFELLQQIEDHKKNNSQIHSELLLQIEALNSNIKELRDNVEDKSKNNFELLQQIEDHKKQNFELETTKNEIIQKYDSIMQAKELQNVDLKSVETKLSENSLELKHVYALLEEAKQQISQTEEKLHSKETELISNLKTHEEQYKLLLSENEQQIVTNKKEIDDLGIKLNETESRLKEKEKSFQELEETILLLKQEKQLMSQHSIELESKQKVVEEELGQALIRVDSLTNSNKTTDDTLNKVKMLIIHTVEEICILKSKDSSQQPLEAVPKITLEMETILKEIQSVSDILSNTNIESLKYIMHLGYVFVKLYEQCNLIYNSTTEFEKGQDIFNKIKSLGSDLSVLFKCVQNGDSDERKKRETIQNILTKLADLNKLVREILDKYENKVDFDKLVEKELQEMDLAIEDAAAKITDLLEKAREKDDKVNLEVNGKIVNACTTLMECIKILIIKSRVLQKEIVSSQKGNASVSEFYRRNTQWSDGLISASKSVAKAANFLVDAANKAIESESGQNFELIVAAQEIAACTTQLVIASKVKANRESTNLADLTKASRNVTKATGTVVATVKDCNSQLEQRIEMDLHKLTPSQIKTMEMEIHVKVLETEQALQTQRMKLSAFRREHYKNTEY
ncbi:huntingtin-interacting protein 1 [Drosophila willistoni]|uniref:huntingtin-interacting protein 1 n=1 Tax=Drosophila willistoni TaxID=7260 RepID=UPI000C26D12A|nr:huntingtin-interacting protein 1 [Drosophila willistoni]